jgi:hypothetical protein
MRLHGMGNQTVWRLLSMCMHTGGADIGAGVLPPPLLNTVFKQMSAVSSWLTADLGCHLDMPILIYIKPLNRPVCSCLLSICVIAGHACCSAADWRCA